MSPYFDASFFSWFVLFIKRLQIILSTLILGEIPSLYADEIQLFSLLSLSLAASFFGTFLLLKRLTMMANALSHTMLLGVVMASLFSYHLQKDFSAFSPPWALVGASLILSLLTVWLVHILSSSRYMTSDAANGMTFTFLFALGVTLLSLLSRNGQIGTDMVMGNIDLLTTEDLSSLSVACFLVLFVGIFFLRGFLVSTFDPVFAGCSGMRPFLMDLILYLLVGIMITFAFKAVGFILSLSYFVIPPLTARLFTHRLRSMLLLSQALSAVACFVGVALSRHLLSSFSISLSTGPLIATLLSVQYVIALLAQKKTKRHLTEKVPFMP